MKIEENLEKLFLMNSYEDVYNNYIQSIEEEKKAWDIVVITAANKNQADSFLKQIKFRKNNNMLPKKTEFYVISDLGDIRIGSGGSTLQVLSFLKEETACKNGFENKKVLILHSGGDSKRLPQYSALGKIFASVPHKIFDNFNSTIFDEMMITLYTVPSRMNSGIFICSGDLIMLFNATQLDFHFHDIVCLSMKTPAYIGTRHGVLKKDENGLIIDFLHKQSLENLREMEAIDKNGDVNIDTGAVYFSPNIVNKLLKLIYKDNKIDKKEFSLFLNDKARINLYGDFLYAMASNSTLEKYLKETAEGNFSDELIECRKKIFNLIGNEKMYMACANPAKFIHFGSTKEFLDLITQADTEYKYLSWSSIVASIGFKSNVAAINSICEKNATIGENSYIEDSYIKKGAKIGKNSIVTGATFSGTLPDNTVLSVLPLNGGYFTARVYGINDNPKDSGKTKSFMGISLIEVLKKYDILEKDLWNNNDISIWNGNIYPICNTEKEAINLALIFIKMLKNLATEEEVLEYKNAKKTSLNESYQNTDIDIILKNKVKLKEKITLKEFEMAIYNKKNIKDCIRILGNGDSLKRNVNNILKMIDTFPSEIKYRIYFVLSELVKLNEECSKISSRELEEQCFSEIKKLICSTHKSNIKKRKIKNRNVLIKLPVRVNFGGSWTDTPPYCLENGGTVLNAAIKLNNEYPIMVKIEVIEENHFEFVSEDINASKIIKDINELNNDLSPNDDFALHKAALQVKGIIRDTDKSLNDVINELGGGLKITTSSNTPKGSGLGTSSILSTALVLAIEKLYDIKFNSQNAFEDVLCMEQLITSGGGWQDQAGVLYPGFKISKTLPGSKQVNNLQVLNLSKETKKELNERFALIFTGQRRFARNLLRSFMKSYLSGDENKVKALQEIKNLALVMADELEMGNVTAFAKLLNKQWELTKLIDSGSTNEIIDLIISSCSHLIDGVLIAGAGGGGFLQVILKENCTKEELKGIINSNFADTGIEVWDSEFEFLEIEDYNN